MVAPDTHGEWWELSGRKEFEEACMQENKIPFSQSTTAGIPFTRQPLLGDFGYLVVGENAKKVLKGEYEPPPHTDEYAKKLLFFLKMDGPIKNPPQYLRFS